jgi:hypothetical protein
MLMFYAVVFLKLRIEIFFQKFTIIILQDNDRLLEVCVINRGCIELYSLFNGIGYIYTTNSDLLLQVAKKYYIVGVFSLFFLIFHYSY